ncbi:SLBB domain-containing protein [Roseateles sp.]|uniref:SLBB domain-containing protein n=1 Tax=Roseateles sp. TaxID=1971397 RepID=UPI00286C4E26|nr:SLBB domain-containing protein [Roseateles sp.]
MKVSDIWQSAVGKQGSRGRAHAGTSGGNGLFRLTGAAALFALAPLLISSAAAQAATGPVSEDASQMGGPVRLREAARANADSQTELTEASLQRARVEVKPTPLAPSEFERYVGGEIRRFGSELMSPAGRESLVQESASQIPQDYIISVGDEILVTLWGSVEADLRLTVDRSGRITLPRVGPVRVAGVRYIDLAPAIDQRVGQVFRNYQLSASLGRLRSIRIYVTGFTQRPGAYHVSGLTTLVNGLMQAGGPSAAGSFRQIELRRAGKTISSFDFYDLLINGNKTADQTLQADDVVHIGPVGPQVALLGSVNKPAIFELKAQDTLADVLAMAGGFSAVADRSRVTLERLDARNEARIVEIALPTQIKDKPRDGDVLRAFSSVDAALPQHRQSKRVKVEGEVQRPGEFILPASSTLADAIKAAGGLTPGAYLYGADFSRESVRVTQTENYERALRNLETELMRNSASQKAATGVDGAAQAAKAQGSEKLLTTLRAVKPTGRIVLQLPPSANSLPDLLVENGDRIQIPPRPTSIGVFGSVFNGGSYLYAEGNSVGDFMKLAGGPTKGADNGSTFVVRANGSVVSARQGGGGWFTSGSVEGLNAEPGDTVFVPEEMDKTTFMQEAKDWTQILAQFALGAAALKTLRD